MKFCIRIYSSTFRFYRKALRLIQTKLWKREYRKRKKSNNALTRVVKGEAILVLDQLKPDHNPGLLIRSADALGATCVYTVAMPYFNVTTSSGSIDNIAVMEFSAIEDCLNHLHADGYTVFALEPSRNIEKISYLDQIKLPRRSAFIVGNELHGVSVGVQAFPDVTWLTIRQDGVIPCLNAAMAGTIGLYEYLRQHYH